jgi:dTDP-4-amino-4,6-dideoxygalactose transaminase
MQIQPLATSFNAYHRPYLPFANARSAMRAFLQSIDFKEGEKILLPAYIGWTEKEGSGVFDPIADLALDYCFYRLNERLEISLPELEACFQQNNVRLVILIHYFGYLDPAYEEAIALARTYGALVLEDEAHALFTDLVGGIAGRLGDVCIFSLHKMLPCSGGALLLNQAEWMEKILVNQKRDYLHDFDLHRIAAIRRRNALYLMEALADMDEYLSLLRPELASHEFPQTLPIVVKHFSRDALYHEMRKNGFGLVSLYYQLIGQIKPEEFPEAHRVSATITNLPLHQDIGIEELDKMLRQLAMCIEQLS